MSYGWLGESSYEWLGVCHVIINRLVAWNKKKMLTAEPKLLSLMPGFQTNHCVFLPNWAVTGDLNYIRE